MNKTNRQYFESRVNSIVSCTNGNIATMLNKKKKGTGLTDARKYRMICDGKAIVKTENQLMRTDKHYSDNGFDYFLKCFEYPLTDTQKEKIAHNETSDQRIDELCHEVELEGKRLIDRVVLGLVETKDIPNELHKLSEMANLARG